MFTVLYNYPLVMVGIELHSSVDTFSIILPNNIFMYSVRKLSSINMFALMIFTFS